MAGFQKVTKHVLPDVLEGSESETVIGDAYANEEFMVGLVAELNMRVRRAVTPSAYPRMPTLRC